MTPPQAPTMPSPAWISEPEAVSSHEQHNRVQAFETLTQRSDFLKAARGRRQGTASMMVQMRRRADDSPAIRVGFTCSKKVGNAVARNRAKRRLREAARLVLPHDGKPGCDYVLIGRAEATDARTFDLLLGDLRYALRKLHRQT